MKLEVLQQGYTYHIYNKGINGTAIFISDENKNYFLRLLKKYVVPHCSIFAYCLMNNHFHLLLSVDNHADVVTQSLSNFFNAYAKAFNKATNRTGSLFEKHFKRIVIHNEDYLKQLVLYIHLNPKRHFDIDYTTYKYSSYLAYLSNKETLLKRDYVMELFNSTDNFIFVHNEKKIVL